MSFGVLPNELILTIFGFVDRRAVVVAVPAVSRQWRTVAAWLVVVDLTWAKKSIDDAGLVGLIHKFPNLAHLHLKNEDRATDAGLRSLLASCPNLESISCIQDGACSVVIMNWFECHISPSLRTLRLYNTRVHKVTTLRDITQHCPNLTRLNLKYTLLRNEGIIAIVAGCSNLTHLNVAVTRVSDAGVVAIGAGCPKLTHLDISLTCARDNGVKAIGAGCPNLVVLDLGFNGQLHDDAIEAIAKGCPNLQRLILTYCKSVGDDGLCFIARGCPHLAHLNVSCCERVTRFGVEAIMAACSRVVVKHEIDGIDSD